MGREAFVGCKARGLVVCSVGLRHEGHGGNRHIAIAQRGNGRERIACPSARGNFHLTVYLLISTKVLTSQLSPLGFRGPLQLHTSTEIALVPHAAAAPFDNRAPIQSQGSHIHQLPCEVCSHIPKLRTGRIGALCTLHGLQHCLEPAQRRSVAAALSVLPSSLCSQLPLLASPPQYVHCKIYCIVFNH